MSGKNVKIAGYNQIEDVLEKLKLVMNHSQISNKPQIFNDASIKYNQLSRMRNTPGIQRNTALQQARQFLNRVSTDFNDLRGAIDQTSSMSNFWNWEVSDLDREKPNYQGIAGKVKYIPSNEKTKPGYIALEGLNFGNSAVANKIRSAMGSWMTSQERLSNPNDPKSFKVLDTYIRATKESWQRFLDLSHLWLDEYEQLANAPEIVNKRFPSESQFNGEISNYENPKANLMLDVSLINFEDKKSVKEWELKGKVSIEPKGIRLQFGENDPNFEKIRDILVRDNEIGFKDVRPYRSLSRFDIYDINPSKFAKLTLKLKGMGYPTSSLNSSIFDATGKSIGSLQEQLSNKNKTADISLQKIDNSLQKNLSNRIDISLFDFRKEAFRKYPNAFDPSKTSPDMQKAQQDGMYFITQRSVSIMADEPGSGKTVQTVCGCDFVTPSDKKILVFSPPSLLNENWGSQNRQSAPEQFCGHNKDQIAQCFSNEDFQKAINSNARWIVIPYSSFANRKDRNLLAASIANAANMGLFGACMLDEIQVLKGLKSNTADLIRQSVTEKIPFRVGMTGTPADNDPSDIYSQLRLLRHPMLFEDGVVRQTERGFTDQFVGGSEASDTSLDPKIRANSVFGWAKSTTMQERIAMLKVFSTTFLRRNKEDIRKDIPERNYSPGYVNADSAGWLEYQKSLKENEKLSDKKGKPWFQTLLEEMGRQKIPFTVSSAVEHLNKNPYNKVFIVTGHPEFADDIASKINSSIGDGVAAAIHGESDDESRQIVPDTFKKKSDDPSSILPGKNIPLRCVIYTMKTGAVGLNFSIANKCIFNDMDWNPSMNLQAEFRCNRIDSKHPVDIQYMVLKGTYDEQVYNRIQQKGNLNNATNNIMRKVYQNKDNPEVIMHLANDYLISIVDSVLLDLPLSTPEQSFFNNKRNELYMFLNSQIPAKQVAAKGWYNKIVH